MALEVTRHRFTTSDFLRLAETGILAEDARVELIDGELVEMSPIGNRHLACVDRCTRVLVRVAGDAAIVRVQGSVRLDEYTQPQPDLLLLRSQPDFYASRGAGAADVLLVVEVADTSLDYDRRVKVPLYARHGIPEMWLLDVRRELLTVHREPAPNGYRSAQVLRRGETVSPLAFPDRAIPLSEILG